MSSLMVGSLRLRVLPEDGRSSSIGDIAADEMNTTATLAEIEPLTPITVVTAITLTVGLIQVRYLSNAYAL